MREKNEEGGEKFMKKCTACQKEIDKKATVCPYCRTKQTGKATKIITGIITVIVFIWILSAIFGNHSQTSGGYTSDSSNSTSPTVTNMKPIVVDGPTLVAVYDKNKLAAQDQYTGKLVQTTGFIANISQDVTGNYYLSINPSNDQYYAGTTIQCYFKDKSVLTSLSNGQSVTVKGTMQDMSLGIVEMQDCSLVK